MIHCSKSWDLQVLDMPIGRLLAKRGLNLSLHTDNESKALFFFAEDVQYIYIEDDTITISINDDESFDFTVENRDELKRLYGLLCIECLH